jgi:S1-C subfamily serine protease
MIATGAIGGILSIAVLWAMLPSTGRGGLATPSVVSSTANDLTSLVSTARAETLVASSVAARPTSSVAAPSSTAAPVAPAPTTAAPATQPLETFAGTNVEEVEPTLTAVAVGDSMVITTARAVEGRSFITLIGSDGQPHDVAVLMVDRDLGVAVLSPEAMSLISSYGIGPAAAAGDAVTIVGSLPVAANVRTDADGHLTLDAWSEAIPEGAAVVNSNGLLVGMCSHGASGPVFVSVANLSGLVAAVNPSTSPYVGVHVIDADRGGPLIDGVDPNGPAAAAGIVAGDVIGAVNGTAVTTVDQLKMAIAAFAPNDTVALTIVHAGQSAADVAVTLSTAPSL